MAFETKVKTELVVRTRPRPAGVVTAERDGLIDLGVGVGLVLALVPADAGEDAQIFGELLLGVQAEAVLHCAEGARAS